MSLLEMRGITKEFYGMRALDNVDFSVDNGEIHALLGENGAGKTTLMNILYGLYQQEAGEIFWNEQPVIVTEPRDAIKLGIGMVHQHFMLVKKMTALENILLGLKLEGYPLFLKERYVERIQALAEKYGLRVDLHQRIDRMAVGEQQRVEILKALFRNAKLLILDEPTAVLTKQETDEFFDILRTLRDEGHSIIFIAHNLSEIMKISDRITVLRDGKLVCVLHTSETNEVELSRYMIGRDFENLEYEMVATDRDSLVLEIEKLTLKGSGEKKLLSDVDLTVRNGEILGIAGVDGNGQTELAEVLVGIRRKSSGAIKLNGVEIGSESVRERYNRGISYIPADRQRDGLIMDADVSANLALHNYHLSPFSKASLLSFSKLKDSAKDLIKKYDVRTPSVSVKVRLLSGGNQQKMILARELQSDGELIIACQPTRGLDVSATEYLRGLLIDRRNSGKSVLLISTDLEEILALSDRIAVMHEGKIMGIVDNCVDIKTETLGLMMGGKVLEEINGSR